MMTSDSDRSGVERAHGGVPGPGAAVRARVRAAAGAGAGGRPARRTLPRTGRRPLAVYLQLHQRHCTDLWSTPHCVRWSGLRGYFSVSNDRLG